jgi:hypothetical protein
MVHVAWSVAGGLVALLARRRAFVVFTHAGDRDAAGRDAQMGPLVEHLRARGERVVEIVLAPLCGAVFAAAVRARRWPLSFAAIAAPARLLAPGGDAAARLRARVRVAGWWLRALRPRAVFLIDESGSGQSLLRAARRLGIRTIGVQHGGFHAGDPVYDLRAGNPGIEPADVLCVWSEWFRDRLCSLSPIYGVANTRATGRLRFAPPPAPRSTDPDALRVLVVGEAGAQFAADIGPFVEALRAAAVEVRERPHPAVGAAARSLAADLADCDAVIGRSSSALLEALHAHRPAIVCGQDAAGWVAEGIAAGAREPAAVVATCRAAVSDRDALARARARVWSGGDVDAAAAIASAAVAPRVDCRR